ncbi:MAG: riboflavin kinase [Candidatus Levyibacteriota bacterium]
MKAQYIFWGKVQQGAKRGKKLGFPTANIRLHKKIPEGIYAAKVRLQNKEYLSATFIGASKTFGERDYKAESFLLDFNQNLYGKWITVYLYKRLRENKMFDSRESLISQMKKDVLATREFFRKSL